jgi:chromosome partitioning protein
MEVLCILNKKGGVGKTTIATNLAQGLAILGNKVLVIDNDEQHNLSSSIGLSVNDCPSGLAEIINAPKGNMDRVVAESVYESFLDNLHCIPGSKGLENLNPRKSALSEILASDVIRNQEYDFVIIDNSPTVNSKTRCAIHCSDFFLLPVQLRQFAVDGLVEMFESLTVEYGINPSKIFILRNMYKPIKSREIASQALAMRYPNNILKTVIPEDEAFEQMVCNAKSMFFSKTKSRGTLYFQHLIGEMFGLDGEEMFEVFKKELIEYRSAIALRNLKRANIIKLSVKEEA